MNVEFLNEEQIDLIQGLFVTHSVVVETRKSLFSIFFCFYKVQNQMVCFEDFTVCHLATNQPMIQQNFK